MLVPSIGSPTIRASCRIRQEAEAIEFILRQVRDCKIEWILSEALADEINRNPQLERRLENSALLKLANETMELDRDVVRPC